MLMEESGTNMKILKHIKIKYILWREIRMKKKQLKNDIEKMFISDTKGILNGLEEITKK